MTYIYINGREGVKGFLNGCNILFCFSKCSFYVFVSAFSEECHIRKRCSLSGHQGPVHGVAMSPNGKILASG